MPTRQHRVEKYFDIQKKNLKRSLRSEPFSTLVPCIDALYGIAIHRFPKTQPPVFGQLLLTCHSSFLAAAALIGQAQPDDGSPITRRAIEAVRLAAAIKLEPMKVEEWLAYGDRMKRWQAREANSRPRGKLKSLKVAHSILEDLMQTYGILSDSAVHFTPEYLHSLQWEMRGEMRVLQYFTTENRSIAYSTIELIGVHRQVLNIFEWCVDGLWSETPEWKQINQDACRVGKLFADRFGSS